MTMLFQLLVNRGEVGQRPMHCDDRRWLGTEQRLFQPRVIPIFRQWPTQPGGVGSTQILVDRGLTDRATAGDLALAQPKLES
jgi:hypothetical protein